MYLRIRDAHAAAQLPGHVEVPKQAVEPHGHRAAYVAGIPGLHPVLQQRDLLEHGGAQLEGRFALGGELEVQRGAFYEATAQLFFEMAYAPAHGGLRQEEPFGRLGKAALRRHLDEAGKMVQVQHGGSSRRRCGFGCGCECSIGARLGEWGWEETRFGESRPRGIPNAG